MSSLLELINILYDYHLLSAACVIAAHGQCLYNRPAHLNRSNVLVATVNTHPSVFFCHPNKNTINDCLVTSTYQPAVLMFAVQYVYVCFQPHT